MIVKLILVLVFLLTIAFVSGVVIGKNGRRNVDRTSSDEEGINEKLSNCIFNSDELRGKYLKLRDAAREKGLVDENDVVNTKIVCSVDGQQKPVESEPTEKSVETEPAEQKNDNAESVEAGSVEQKDAEPKPVEEQRPVETTPEAPQKSAEQSNAEPKQKSAEPEKADNTKTIDEILSEKKADTKKGEESKCHFSIQLAFLDSIDQVNASKKEFKALKLRVLDGESKGKKWYKVRTGCFDSREAAEAELSKVKKIKKDAFIVSE